MTNGPADNFRAIVSQLRAEIAQRQAPPTSHDGSDVDSPVLIAVDEYSNTYAKVSSGDRGPALDDSIRSILILGRAHRIQIRCARSTAAISHYGWPGHTHDPRHVPHKSAFPLPFENVLAGGPRLNRRARRLAAHRRGSSS